jgi:hypothetical protein
MMRRYIAHANIDHYLDLLHKDDISLQNRVVITKLLIDEEDKLGHDLEQLEFAERRAAEGRDRVSRLRNLRSSFVAGSTDRVQADRLLANVEGVQHLIENFCHQLRQRVSSRAL